MNIFTVKGRIQTKLITYILLAGITAVISAVTKQNFWLLFTVAVPVGLILESIWGVIVMYQPPWMTMLFGMFEFAAITTLAVMLALPFTVFQAGLYYLISWVLIELFLIYVMPVLDLSWGDNGGEIW